MKRDDGGSRDALDHAEATVARLVADARVAQADAERWTQEEADAAALAAGWAIIHPGRNRVLAEHAVAATGLGNVEDKVVKNERKTLGLLRDLAGARSVGVVAEHPELGITEIARPVGVVAAITPSTNPGATPANNIVNALKGRNAIVVAPSPKGHSTAEMLVGFVHAELDRVGAPRGLVQLLPAPITRGATIALMRAADLVVATGSQANVRAAYASGTPAIGVGAGNVAVIVDATADVEAAAGKIARSKTFDHATSCSSENSLVIVDAVYDPALAALARTGGALLDAGEKQRLAETMWPDGKLSPTVTAQSAATICALAGLRRDGLGAASFLMVEETGVGPDCPFSGEKLSPVLTLYRARDFDEACAIVRRIYAFQGAGHSIGIHTADDRHVLRLGLEMPAARVIVNQAHAIANGGSFDNGLPFSLSMGCGTWGRNSISDNLNYRHFLNITRIARPIPERKPTIEQVFGAWWARYGKG